MNDHVAGKAAERMLEKQFAALRPELLRFATWLARDRALAEDVVQETLLRAWKARAALADPSRLKAWLCTIASREHARMYARKRLPTIDLDALVAFEDPSLAEAALATGDAERVRELRAAMLRLPDDYRVPLAMQVLGGFTAAEIGAELGLGVPAVLTRLFRARDRLRVIYGLAPRDVDGGDDESRDEAASRDNAGPAEEERRR